MKPLYDTGIIGGGVIGLAAAYYLSKSGLRVAVFESGKTGSGASRAAAGMLGAHTETEENDAFFKFAKESQALYPGLAQDLLSECGIDIQLQYNGMYKLAMTAEEAMFMEKRAELEPHVEWHAKEYVLKNEPDLIETIHGALRIEKDGQVSPVLLCEALKRAIMQMNGKIYENTQVYKINRYDISHYEIQTVQGDYLCESLVVANGAWSSYLLEGFAQNTAIHPVKGECLSVTLDGCKLRSTVFHESCYLVPKLDGKIIIGATMETGNWNQEPTIRGISSLMEKAKRMMPGIERARFHRAWAGLRPGSVDGKPYIGRLTGIPNLYVAAGHYRNGILLAPRTGVMIRDLVLNRTLDSEYIHAFQLKRSAEVRQ